MAGERRGKIFEGLCQALILQIPLCRKEEVHREVVPPGMNIKVDILSGKDPANPKFILLLNASGGKKATEKKFWRNMGELVEAKTFIESKSPPLVYGLTVGRIKDAHVLIQAQAFDNFTLLDIDENEAAMDLWNYLSELKEALPTAAIDQEAYYSKAIKSSRPGMQLLRKVLPKAISGVNEDAKSVWSYLRSRTRPRPIGERRTAYKKAFTKALLFSSSEQLVEAFSAQGSTRAVPEHLMRLGLVRSIKGTYYGNDPDLRKLLAAFDVKLIKKVFNLKNQKMEGWIASICDPSEADSIFQYVKDRIDAYGEDWSLLYKDLINCHKAPKKLLGKNVDVPDRVWLLDALMEFLRASSSSDNSYGYIQLSQDIADSDGPCSHLPEETRTFLLSPWDHLSEWIGRDESDIDDDVVQAIAIVISNRLKGIPKNAIAKALERAKQGVARSLMEVKIGTYNGFDPMNEVVSSCISANKKQRRKNCFADKIGLNGAGKTETGGTESVYIKWQSCTDAGRDHKRKELCGRAITMRLQWNGSSYIENPELKKLILMLDGTWRQSDINALLKAGWDEIFYPDEMDQLAQAVA